MSSETVIAGLIDGSDVSIISSVDKDGFPNTKAMLAVRKREGIKHLYFSTNTSSTRVSQYLKNPKSCVYFFDARIFQGAMLIGTMDVLMDQASKDMIWRDGDDLYYPKGVTDPDYCVLRFTAQTCRFYSDMKSENFVVD